MSSVLTVVAHAKTGKITPALLDIINTHADQAGVAIGDTVCLRHGIAYDITLDGGFDIAPIRDLCNQQRVDVALLPTHNRRKKILLSDMDSTVLQMETLDYMCDLLGIGEQVAEITERGMRGEIDFTQSLTERVALMTGMSTHVVDEMLCHLNYTEGAKTTIQTLVKNGVDCALVSGGFTFTTQVVARELGFQNHHANVLGVVGNTFTGTLVGDIAGPATKGLILKSMVQNHGMTTDDVCAIGDGANDIPIIQMAGLGVAFYGKPKVQQATPVHINVTDYSTLLYYMGYHRDEFVI